MLLNLTLAQAAAEYAVLSGFLETAWITVQGWMYDWSGPLLLIGGIVVFCWVVLKALDFL